MIGLTLKHLRYLDALSRHGHFGRAAADCAITQPALSIQIKELEALVGAPLVERAARRIRLTALGEDFVERARDILLKVEDLEDLVRASAAPMAGRLRIGVIPTVAPYLLPEIIVALSRHFPELDLEPREAITPALIDSLIASRLDVAIVALPMSEPAFREFALFEEEFVLVRSAGQSGLPVPRPDLLSEMRLLLLEEGHCFRDQALSFCKLSSSAPRQVMEGNSLTTLVQMVGSGMGVTLIPEMAIPLETRSANVGISRFPGPKPRRTIGMVWRRTNPLADRLMKVGAIVRGVGQAKRAEIAGAA